MAMPGLPASDPNAARFALAIMYVAVTYILFQLAHILHGHRCSCMQVLGGVSVSVSRTHRDSPVLARLAGPQRTEILTRGDLYLAVSMGRGLGQGVFSLHVHR